MLEASGRRLGMGRLAPSGRPASPEPSAASAPRPWPDVPTTSSPNLTTGAMLQAPRQATGSREKRAVLGRLPRLDSEHALERVEDARRALDVAGGAHADLDDHLAARLEAERLVEGGDVVEVGLGDADLKADHLVERRLRDVAEAPPGCPASSRSRTRGRCATCGRRSPRPSPLAGGRCSATRRGVISAATLFSATRQAGVMPRLLDDERLDFLSRKTVPTPPRPACFRRTRRRRQSQKEKFSTPISACSAPRPADTTAMFACRARHRRTSRSAPRHRTCESMLSSGRLLDGDAAGARRRCRR